MDTETRGNIHTCMLELTNPATINRQITDRRITSDYFTKSGTIRRLRVNANNGTLHSPQTGNSFFLGECMSLLEFETSLKNLCDKAEISLNDIVIVRIDFKFDYGSPENVQKWVKICDLLIAAFIAKHHVTEKNQYRGTSFKGTHKSSKAKWGSLEMENYNKSIQQESKDTLYRFEIRCVDTKGKQPREVLRKWAEELSSLKKFYEIAQDNANMALIPMWEHMKDTANEPVRLNEFIRWHGDFIYSRAQLRRLYKALGHTNPKRAADSYCEKCGSKNRLFISKGDFEKYIDLLRSQIEAYISGESQADSTPKIYHPQGVYLAIEKPLEKSLCPARYMGFSAVGSCLSDTSI